MQARLSVHFSDRLILSKYSEYLPYLPYFCYGKNTVILARIDPLE
jgi:hypothetical protein